MNNNMNIYWLLFHLFQVCIFQFFAAEKMSNFTYIMLKKRNTDQSSSVLPTSKMPHHKNIDTAIGIFSMGLLALGFFLHSNYIYWSGKYLSLFGFLLTVLFIDLFQYSKFKNKIPLSSKRTASLNNRFVGKIIPLWWWIAYVVSSVAYLYFSDDLKSQLFLGISIIIILIIAYFIEKRSKLPMSTVDDELYRKSEMWTVYIIGWTFLIINPLKKYFGFYGIDAIFSTLPLFLFVIFLNSKLFKKITDET